MNGIKLVAAAAVWALAGCGHTARYAPPRMIVLGIDGMDPTFLERHWGDLPNLDQLRRKGEFKRLQTVMPPQSPVAWSSFITGMNPGGHGIYDFVQRRPETLAPYSSLSAVLPPRWQLPLGPYLLPLSRGRVESFRHGKPFWDKLAERGIPVTVLRMPMNFPPTHDDDDELSGMGAPDLQGTAGTFSFFTDAPGLTEHAVNGGRFIPVRVENNRAHLRLPGPPNTLRRDGAGTFVDVTVDIDPESPAARFNAQGRDVVLAEGEWSGWLHVKFPLLAVIGVPGMFRLYVKQLHPALEIYASPVNLDPEDAAMPIANPPEYAGELARAVGPYYTQGMPQDTAALREGVFTVDEYLAQSRLVSDEHLRVLRYAVEHSTGGLLFFHFYGVDQDSHMLWGRHEAQLLDTYRMVDRTVGWIMERVPDAHLVVMSDHGFDAFDRAVHVNRVLAERGLLALKDPDAPGDGEGFANVDWAHTEVYAVGLNAVYLNLAGRERMGTVQPRDGAAVLQKTREALQELRDPANGEPAVEEVYRTAQLYPGADPHVAPDLLVGYRPGYRASWQTVLGGTPRGLVVPNDDAWIGDHCIDARFVPGVLLTDRPIGPAQPAITDMTANILEEFHVR